MYETVVNLCKTVAWGTALIGVVFSISLAIIETQKNRGSIGFLIRLRALLIISFLFILLFGTIGFLFGLMFPITVPLILICVYNGVIRVGFSENYICFKWDN